MVPKYFHWAQDAQLACDFVSSIPAHWKTWCIFREHKFPNLRVTLWAAYGKPGKWSSGNSHGGGACVFQTRKWMSGVSMDLVAATFRTRIKGGERLFMLLWGQLPVLWVQFFFVVGRTAYIYMQAHGSNITFLDNPTLKLYTGEFEGKKFLRSDKH